MCALLLHVPLPSVLRVPTSCPSSCAPSSCPSSVRASSPVDFEAPAHRPPGLVYGKHGVSRKVDHGTYLPPRRWEAAAEGRRLPATAGQPPSAAAGPGGPTPGATSAGAARLRAGRPPDEATSPARSGL